MTEHNRIEWLDLAKVIGIYLVVLGHLPSMFGGAIFMFHMPLFFILSGWLYKARDFKSELKRSAKSLLVPYVLFSVLMLVEHTIKGDMDFSSAFVLWITGQWEILPGEWRSLWFLLVLFQMRLLSSICKSKAITVAIILFVVSIVHRYSLLYDYNTDYLQLSTTCLCYVFFVLGSLLHRNETRVFQGISQIRPNRQFFVFILSAVFLLVIGKLNGSVNVFRTNFGHSALLFLIHATGLSLLFIIAMHNISDIFKKYMGGGYFANPFSRHTFHPCLALPRPLSSC